MFGKWGTAALSVVAAVLSLAAVLVAYSWLFGARVGLMVFVPPPSCRVTGVDAVLVEDGLYTIEGRSFMVEEGMEIALRFQVGGEERSFILIADRGGEVVDCVGCFGVGRIRPGIYFVWLDTVFEKFKIVPVLNPRGHDPVPPQNGLG
jgi:hypothetical protein